MIERATRSALPFAFAAVLGACSGGSVPAPTPAPTDGPRIVQPGAPGQASRSFSLEELANVQGVSYTPADVAFMQGMIPHHAQALEMTALVRKHATTDAVRRMALRMEISQRDEIAMMESWLRERDEPVAMPGTHSGHVMPGMDGAHLMPGMLTPDQMRNLENARGVAFDRLFLEYMIQHHLGATDMVAKLFMTSGAAQESTVFKFAEDVEADQTMEIERMRGILETLR